LSRAVVVDIEGVVRTFAPDEFPIEVGGSGAAVPLSGTNATVAHLGLTDDELYLQPRPGAEPIACNGTRLASSRWLRDGDRIRAADTEITVAMSEREIHLTARRLERDDKTEPPVIIETRSVQTDDVETTIAPLRFEPRAAERPEPRRGSSGLIATLLLLALAACAGFVFLAQPVLIEVVPPPDRIRVDGALLAPHVGERYLLLPGSYTVLAERSGHRPLRAPIDVSGQVDQEWRFALEPLPGLLSVVTEPPIEARLEIDGRSVGRLPLAAVELASGPHEIRVIARRHREHRETITIEGPGTEQTVTVELAPDWAPVSLDSVPPGATVWIDGEVAGQTPVTAEVGAGRRTVEWRLDGYRRERRTIEVEADRALVVEPVVLKPADGHLELVSAPSATVSVDGQFRGRTPIELELAPDREHRLELSRDGYEATTRTVTLRSGESRRVELTLAARIGEIQIDVEPKSATIQVDGVEQRPTDGVLRLPAVPHVIELSAPGYVSQTQTVTPRPGFPQAIRARLVMLEEAARAATPAILHASGGHELRLIAAGSFETGASRRQPGRRSNETILKVELRRRFYVAVHEVSNGQLRAFRAEHLSGNVNGVSLERDDHPAVRVTWEDAARYCNWLSAQDSLPAAYDDSGAMVTAVRPITTGYRMPTEAEWVWVARYGGGGPSLKYPWGDSLPLPPNSGNYADGSANALVSPVLDGYDDSFPTTAPVTSFAASALGFYHLGDNVAEWAHDIYTIYPARGGAAVIDPIGPTEGEHHTIRGASWKDGRYTDLRLSYRDYGNKARPDVGFRIARYLE